MPKISAWFGADGLTDVGYTIKNGNTTIAARTQTGVSGVGDGWYEVAAGPTLATGERIIWDSPTLSGLKGIEYADENAIAIAANAGTAASQATTAATQATAANTKAGLIQVVTDKLNSLLELVSGTTYRLTAAALALAPTTEGSLTSEQNTWLSQVPSIKAKTDSLGTGTIVSVSPVLENGDVTIVRGDDYYAEDGRALEWESDSWPDLTGATLIEMTVDNPALLQVVGSVVTAGSGTQKVRVEMSRAQSALLVSESYNFDVKATLATSAHKATLVPNATITVTDAVSN